MMAEQDRKDAVPSVLNDLIDVDGTPAEGDGMSFSDGAWRPGPAAGLLPPYGPALTYWLGEHSGSLADNDAIQTAWHAMAVTVAAGYEDYPGVHPPLGEWVDVLPSLLSWRATEPGIYSAAVEQRCAFGAAPGASSVLQMGVPMSAITSYSSGIKRFPVLIDTGGAIGRRVDHLILPISQGMIDAGWGGFDVKTPTYTPNGAERVNALTLYAIIERHSPGSTFDYYGEL